VDAGSALAPPRPAPHVIRPASRWPTFGLRELWKHRELLYFLAWRDLKVRYKQTSLGIAWAVVQPLLYTFVATLLFKRILNVYAVGAYELVALAGFVLWLPFQQAITLASNSLVGNVSLVTRVYFPRLLAPLGIVAAAIVDVALATGLLLVVMVLFGEFPDPARMWVAIPFVLLAGAVAAGIGSWLAAINVKYRDVRFLVPFFLQLWIFPSSVFFTYEALNPPSPWSTIYWLNPMAGIVEGFRWSMLGGVRPSVDQFAISAGVAVAILVAGLASFRRREREFADVV
jgi:lipopolysaccharide transport system permease protein